MKIYELDKSRKRTGITRDVPTLHWRKMLDTYGKKVRWEAEEIKPVKIEPIEIKPEIIEPVKVKQIEPIKKIKKDEGE